MGHFLYRDDITSADFAFDAYGSTLEELFRECADALLGLMISDVALLRPRIHKRVILRGTAESLLF